MRLFLLLSSVILLKGCRQSTAPGDPPHMWEVRYDIARVPHSYPYCTNGHHEPRDSTEWADAMYWYAHRASASPP